MRLTKEQWKKAEHDFIVNSYTYDKISKKYNVSIQSICAMSKKLQWNDKVEIYLNKKKEKHEQKLKEALSKVESDGVKLDNDILSETWANFDLKCLNLTNKALDLCSMDLDALRQYKIDYETMPDDVKQRVSKHTTTELNNLSKAIETYQKIGKNAVGETMNNGNITAEIKYSLIGVKPDESN